MPFDWKTLPKTELHLHLEGAIPVNALFELVKKHKRTKEASSVEAVKRRYEFDDFGHFLEVYKWTVSFLKGADDYEFVAYEVGKRLASQNVLYAEVMVGLGNSVMYGGHDSQDIVRAAARGLKAAEVQHGIRIRIQVATGRDHGAQFSLDRLRDIEPLLGDVDICAFNMGGSEHVHPLPQFAKVFERAHEMGLQVSVHAGEVSGPQDVRDAISIRPQRIGHGIRAALDTPLMHELTRLGIALEICPVSNECTGAIPRLADHPLPRLIREGVPITLSSDDPAMFHTSISMEYAVAHEVLGIDTPTLVGIAREGFKRAFLPEDERAKLLVRFEREARQWCTDRGITYPEE